MAAPILETADFDQNMLILAQLGPVGGAYGEFFVVDVHKSGW